MSSEGLAALPEEEEQVREGLDVWLASCAHCAGTAPRPPLLSPAIPTPTHTTTHTQVTLVVATAEGLLYEYSIEELSAPAGPKCSLAGEWALLGSTGLSAGV